MPMALPISDARCFFAIDVETASEGIHDTRTEVIQVAVCRIDLTKSGADRVEQVYNAWFQPTGNVTEAAFRIHRMSKKDLEKYKFFGPDDAKEILYHVEGGQGVIGHNVIFDHNVLFRQFNLVGASNLTDPKKWPPFFDTQETARRLGYKTKHNSLKHLLYSLLDIELVNAHDAREDAAGAARLWLWWVDAKECVWMK